MKVFWVSLGALIFGFGCLESGTASTSATARLVLADGGSPATQTSTGSKTATATPASAALIVPVARKAPPRAPKCGGAPAWTKLGVCRAGDQVFAVGFSVGSKVPGVSISKAIAAALGNLAGDFSGALELSSVEFPDSYVCKKTRFVLARSRDPRLQSAGLPDCDPEALAARGRSKGCPEWTLRLSELGDGPARAVGFVEGIRNKSLAEQAAADRARERLAIALHGVKLERAGGELRASVSGTLEGAQVTDRARCGRTSYVRVSIDQAPR